MKTFKKFIETAPITRDPAGRFVDYTRCVYRVSDLIPNDFESAEHLAATVALRGGPPDAEDAARAAWERFEKWRAAKAK
jgi:hypothetical protein